MSRTKDVDTVAPDDPIVSAAPTKKVTTQTVTTTTTTAPLSDSTMSDKVYSLFGHTKHPFSSALIMPKVLTFAEKNDDEVILIALRSHWFTNVPWIIITVFMLFVPSLLRFIPSPLFPANLQVILILAWYMVTFAYSFEQFLSWYFDLFLITNHRIVDIDFNNLLDKKFSEADLSKIQDVTSRVSGVSQTFLNYGTVLIQTAAENNEIIFEKVPQPDKIVKILQDLRHDEESKGGDL